MNDHFNKNLIESILLISIFIFSSCIEQFKPELNTSDQKSQLVVEGTITDQPGPFKVRLTKSSSVYAEQDIIRFDPVTGATVHITDDKGNDFQLYQGVKGWYQTADSCLQGVPGNTYTLHVTDEDGNKYESTPELMLEVPPIESLFFEEKQRTHIEGETVTQEAWLDILLNTYEPAGEIHYSRWDFEETWEFNMPQYIPVVRHTGEPPCILEKIGDTEFMTWVGVPAEQSHCWTTETSKSILVNSTAVDKTGRIVNYPIKYIGPDDDRISIRYSILVKQYELNKELYYYFKRLESLNETNGGMFDKLPSPLYGNIKSVSGSNKPLGYFLVSGIKMKRIFIDNSDTHIKTGHSAYSSCGWSLPPLCVLKYFYYGKIIDGYRDVGYDVWSTSNYCTDCRVRGTSVRPDFW
jgi:hypothetical protein